MAYRKIELSMWGDQKFASLTPVLPSGKSLWIYLLAGPDTNIIPGVLKVGKASIAEALEWSIDDVTRCFEEIERQEMAVADWGRRLVRLPKGILHNPPANPSIVTRWRKEFLHLPECAIRTQLNLDIESLLVDMDRLIAESGKTPGYLSAWHGDQRQRARSVSGVFEKQHTAVTVTHHPHGVVKSAPTITHAPHSVEHGVPHGAARNEMAKTTIHPTRTITHAPHSVEHSVDSVGATLEKSHQDSAQAVLADFELLAQANGSEIDETVAPQASSGETNECAITQHPHRDPHYRSSNRNRSSNSNNIKQLAPSSPSSSSVPVSSVCVSESGVCESENQKAQNPVSSNPVIQPSTQEPLFELLPVPADPSFIEIPVVGAEGVYSVKESKVAQYIESFPAVDVRQELRHIRQWSLDNPRKRKTFNGAPAFISNWLTKTQNNATVRPGGDEVNFGYPGIGKVKQMQPVLTLTPSFLRFWKFYPPGRGDQQECFRVWQSMYPDISEEMTEEIVKGVKAWTRSPDWMSEGGRYIPGPLKFIREERWKAPPAASRHVGLVDHEESLKEAQFSGMKLRDIRKARIEEEKAKQERAGA